MAWWGWLILAVVVLCLVVAALMTIQLRRRSGTVIAVQRRGRRMGKGGA
ncbi:hypothetical protein [Streptomyces orinoci]|uniref:Secreted protein n=1 Tax=Streptomyces orinoci TaxID=67339 RepID=A0ABV3K571_STRON|nr:hypothetical protein [Streptomyces orinoci]